jgi:excisionase family DNA binding protein
MINFEESSQKSKDFLLLENQIANEWLCTKDAARFLSVSESALRMMVYRGQIQPHTFGRRLRFRTQDLRSLFQKKEA